MKTVSSSSVVLPELQIHFWKANGSPFMLKFITSLMPGSLRWIYSPCEAWRQNWIWLIEKFDKTNSSIFMVFKSATALHGEQSSIISPWHFGILGCSKRRCMIYDWRFSLLCVFTSTCAPPPPGWQLLLPCSADSMTS